MMKTIGDRRRRRCNFILEDNEDYVLVSFEVEIKLLIADVY